MTLQCTGCWHRQDCHVQKVSVLSQVWITSLHGMSYLWLVTEIVSQQAAYRPVRLIVRLSSAVLSCGHVSTIFV